jgi:hypothetical protein
MKKRKYLIFSLVLLFAISQAMAQESERQYEENVPENIIPASPTATSLGLYAEVPVSLFTGVPNIQIPFYEIKTQFLSLPVSLSYHSGGIKVQTTASPVGLGWSLNAGGVITRSVKKYPDDYDFEKPTQIGRLEKLPTLDEISLLTQADLKTLDGQPDEFYYNFNGHSGMFVYENKDQVRFAEMNNWEVETNLDANGAIIEIIIHTDDGVNYFFNKIEKQYNLLLSNSTYYSAWYLTKITTSTSIDDIITIIYEEEDFFDASLGGFKYPCTTCAVVNNISNYLATKAQRVNRIEWKNGYIEFFYQTDRDDILAFDFGTNQVTSSKCQALSQMYVYNANGDLIKFFFMDYDYFTVAETQRGFQGQTSDLYNITSFDFLKKKLRLTSITESNQTGSLPPYVFGYNDLSVPARDSYEQDFWGYYNGNGANTLKPSVYYYPDGTLNNIYLSKVSIFPRVGQGTEIYAQNANRWANPTYMQAGILKKITYPTGGYAEFEFEPDTFYYDGANRIGGGLRISKKKLFDGNQTEITNYSYNYRADNSKTSGNIVFLPQVADNTAYSTSTTTYNGTLYSTCQKGLGTTNGSHVGYKEVTVSKTGIGSTTYKYDYPIAFGEEPDDLETVGVIYQRPTIEYWGDQPDGVTKNIYPYPQEPNYSWNRGQLREESYYDEAGNPLKTIKYQYEVKDWKKTEGIVWRYLWPNSSNVWYFIYSRYYYISAWKTLVSKEETDYRNTTMTSTTNIESDINSKRVFKTTQTTSDNRMNVTYTLYPQMYHEGSGSYVGRLLDYRLYNKPIEIITAQTDALGNNMVITGGRFFTYYSDGQYPPLVKEVFNLETAAPVSLPLFKFSNQLEMGNTPFTEQPDYFDINNIDERYSSTPEKKYTYNSQSKPVFIEAGTSNKTAIVWGYDGEYPIAEVSNATTSEIFCSSFEENPGIYAFHAYTLANDRSFTGDLSLKSEKPSAGEYYYYMPKLTITGNKTFKYSVWVYSTATSADLHFFYQNTNDAYLGAGYVGNYVRTTEKNKWVLLQGEVTVPANKYCIYLRVDNNGSGTVWFDEIRLYPSNAQMTTMTYKPLVGITSETGPDANTIRYEHDNFGRVFRVKDGFGNLIKEYEYHYANQ